MATHVLSDSVLQEYKSKYAYAGFAIQSKKPREISAQLDEGSSFLHTFKRGDNVIVSTGLSNLIGEDSVDKNSISKRKNYVRTELTKQVDKQLDQLMGKGANKVFVTGVGVGWGSKAGADGQRTGGLYQQLGANDMLSDIIKDYVGKNPQYKDRIKFGGSLDPAQLAYNGPKWDNGVHPKPSGLKALHDASEGFFTGAHDPQLVAAAPAAVAPAAASPAPAPSPAAASPPALVHAASLAVPASRPLSDRLGNVPNSQHGGHRQNLRELSSRMTVDDVKKLQDGLHKEKVTDAHGQQIRENGKLGEKTIEGYQKHANLKPDGKLGPATWDAMKKDPFIQKILNHQPSNT